MWYPFVLTCRPIITYFKLGPTQLCHLEIILILSKSYCLVGYLIDLLKLINIKKRQQFPNQWVKNLW